MHINKNLLFVFIASIFIIIGKKFYYDTHEKELKNVTEIISLFYDFSLAYAGGFIFYYIATIDTYKEQKERNKISNKQSYAYLLASIENTIIFSMHIIGKGNIITNTSEISSSLIDVEKDKLQVTLDEEIENNKVIIDGIPVNRKYFAELSKLCSNIQENNNKLLNNTLILPLETIELLNNLSLEKLNNFVKRKITLNEYFSKKSGTPMPITRKENIEFMENTKSLIEIYLDLKKSIENNIEIEWENREIFTINFEIGLMSDKFTKWKRR